jgi:3-phosphoshikimate 1-carboxyvinyltransferase
VITISKTDKILKGLVTLPASKSISNRYLLLQYYYNNSFPINNLSGSDDTLLLSSTLDRLSRYKQNGESGLLRIDARNAGSVMRFLVPLLSLTRGLFLLTGSVRMKKRPVGALVEAMRATGADIDYLEDVGYPPLLIRGRPISFSRISLDASLSSQFITALLLLAPTLDEGLTIELTTPSVSWPYVNMTIGILTGLGIQVISQENSIRVFPGKVIKSEVTVEADWSSASFWYCMLALAEKGELFFPGLQKSGLQGDQDVSRIFRQLGVETIVEKKGLRIRKTACTKGNILLDFNDHPDLALPSILACAASDMPATITGMERLVIKESDRLEALAAGLEQAGITLRETFPGIWQPEGRLIDPCELIISDFSDHRVAMTFASLAMKGFSIHLEHPEVVNKSYPGFFYDLEKTGFTCSFSC